MDWRRSRSRSSPDLRFRPAAPRGHRETQFAERDRVDTELFARADELLLERGERTDEDVGRLEDVLRGEIDSGPPDQECRRFARLGAGVSCHIDTRGRRGSVAGGSAGLDTGPACGSELNRARESAESGGIGRDSIPEACPADRGCRSSRIGGQRGPRVAGRGARVAGRGSRVASGVRGWRAGPAGRGRPWPP